MLNDQSTQFKPFKLKSQGIRFDLSKKLTSNQKNNINDSSIKVTPKMSEIISQKTTHSNNFMKKMDEYLENSSMNIFHNSNYLEIVKKNILEDRQASRRPERNLDRLSMVMQCNCSNMSMSRCSDCFYLNSSSHKNIFCLNIGAGNINPMRRSSTNSSMHHISNKKLTTNMNPHESLLTHINFPLFPKKPLCSIKLPTNNIEDLIYSSKTSYPIFQNKIMVRSINHTSNHSAITILHPDIKNLKVTSSEMHFPGVHHEFMPGYVFIQNNYKFIIFEINSQSFYLYRKKLASGSTDGVERGLGAFGMLKGLGNDVCVEKLFGLDLVCSYDKMKIVVGIIPVSDYEFVFVNQKGDFSITYAKMTKYRALYIHGLDGILKVKDLQILDEHRFMIFTTTKIYLVSHKDSKYTANLIHDFSKTIPTPIITTPNIKNPIIHRINFQIFFNLIFIKFISNNTISIFGYTQNDPHSHPQLYKSVKIDNEEEFTVIDFTIYKNSGYIIILGEHVPSNTYHVKRMKLSMFLQMYDGDRDYSDTFRQYQECLQRRIHKNKNKIWKEEFYPFLKYKYNYIGNIPQQQYYNDTEHDICAYQQCESNWEKIQLNQTKIPKKIKIEPSSGHLYIFYQCGTMELFLTSMNFKLCPSEKTLLMTNSKLRSSNFQQS